MENGRRSTSLGIMSVDLESATIRDVYQQLQGLGGAPALTWYTPLERIELSGNTLINWINKTTNLLVMEFDAAPGEQIGLHLPPHWRTATWAVATWLSGAELVVLEDPQGQPSGEVSEVGNDCEVVISHLPHLWSAANEVVAVPLASLARSFGAGLPSGAVDAASAVMTYSDALGYVAPWEGSAPALRQVGGQASNITHADLVAAALAQQTSGARKRAIVLTGAQTFTAPVLLTLLAQWAEGGSVVLADADFSAELQADPDRLARLIDSERVETTLEL